MKHVVLINDARHFVGCDGYPTQKELREVVKASRPGWVMAVETTSSASIQRIIHPGRE